MADAAENVWPEENYLRYLAADRALYAWCLTRVGGVPVDKAAVRAEARFPYEPQGTPYHGLIHHAGAWQIAMLDLFGGHTRQPEEFGLAAELEAESLWLFHGERKTAEPGAAADAAPSAGRGY